MKKTLLLTLMFVLSACGPAALLSPTPTSVSTLPDLTVASAYVSMTANNGVCLGYYGLNITVVNQGGDPAPDVILAETNTGQEVHIGTLAALQSVTLPFVANSTSGAYVIVVDPRNAIPESNEGNNSLSYADVTATPPANCPPLFTDATPTPVPPLPTFTPPANDASAPFLLLPPTPTPQSLVGLIYADTQHAQIWKVVGSDNSVQILQGNTAQFSRDGLRAVFPSGGDLFLAAPMDNPGVNISNTPRRLEQYPRWWQGADPPKIVFGSAPSEDIVAPHEFFLSMVNLDGSGYEVLASTPSYTPPAPNPNGKSIAYEEHGKPMTYVTGWGSAPFEPQKFGYEPAKEAIFFNPAWSPDGRWLSWWVSDKLDAPQKYELVAFDHLAANAYVSIYAYAPQFGSCCGLPAPVWSPDSAWIAFETRGEANLQELRISRLDGSSARLLSSGAANPVWSPDCQHLAYMVTFSKVSPELAGALLVTEISTQDVFAASLPAWSIPLACVQAKVVRKSEPQVG